jgi:hypothetical protein
MQIIIKYSILFFITGCWFFSFGQDKNLDYYLSAAVTNSPLLNDYHNQLLSNNIDRQILHASTKIQITGNGSSFYAPVVNGFGYDAAITNGGQLQSLITATKALLPKKFLATELQNIKITGDSLRIVSLLSEQELKRAIIAQYISVYGDQLQIDFNYELVNLLSREEIVLKRLTQNNIYKQVDYLSFLVTLQQQSLARQQLSAQYRNDFASLNYLAGIFDTTAAQLVPPDIVGVKDYRKDSSPFFLKFTIDSLRLINNKSLIDLGYRPHINLFGDGGYQSSFMTQPYKNFGTSFGVNFILPIYDGRQKKLQYIKLGIAERTRSKNREFFENQYAQAIAQLQQQLTAIENLLGPLTSQIKYIKTLIDADGKLLETGDIKMTDYILAINNLITAQNLVTQNTLSRYQIINQLNYWER